MGSVLSNICGRNLDSLQTEPQNKYSNLPLTKIPESVTDSETQVSATFIPADLAKMKRCVKGSSGDTFSASDTNSKRQKTESCSSPLNSSLQKSSTGSKIYNNVLQAGHNVDNLLPELRDDNICDGDINQDHICNNCGNVQLITHVVQQSGDSQETSILSCEYCGNIGDGKTLQNHVNSANNEKQFNLLINDLPSSLLISVFQKLSLQDILHRVSLVCKQWHNLCCDPDLWRSINLRGQLKVHDALLLRLTSYSGNVTSLDLTDIRLITNEGMVSALKQCTQIQFLSLVRCMHLTDYAFQAIGVYCPQLKTVKLDCCSALTDLSMTKIGSGCVKLEQLSLNQCSSITDQGLINVLEGCNNLKVLTLEQCREITDASLKALAENCPDIRRLTFMSNGFTTDGINLLTKLRKLEELEITQVTDISDDNVIQLTRHCTQLMVLNVSLCNKITDRSVSCIPTHCKNIKHLYLVACKLTDKALFSLAKCLSLEKLDVGWCTDITDAGAVKISEGCRDLQYLGLMRCDLLTKDTIQDLVNRFPGITYSTMWLECERLIERARCQGLTV